MNSALEAGYRHIDTAFAYQNEQIIGNVLKEWITSGRVKREDLFITTKLPPSCLEAGSVESYMKKSLEALQLDFVDLYLIHVPWGWRTNEKTGEREHIDTDYLAIWKVSFNN